MFSNDGSLPSLIAKALKRTMAGEYSRELGVKVLEGQRRSGRLGFKQGAMPGYGLRRMLISADGTRKQLLASGERKSIATDRVILVPGPAHEVQVVRSICRMLISEGRTVYGIARELNRRRVPYLEGSLWDYTAVYGILTHRSMPDATFTVAHPGDSTHRPFTGNVSAVCPYKTERRLVRFVPALQLLALRRKALTTCR
ncbi:MAG TPA: recombinase family protein [Candidatus Aquilonibacter sp.]|jgi:hypothetical protein|nr:recombinase family protein [Candidatus Aquilonibacter sp.]